MTKKNSLISPERLLQSKWNFAKRSRKKAERAKLKKKRVEEERKKANLKKLEDDRKKRLIEQRKLEEEKQRRIQRQWEERREQQRRRAAMSDSATIIQRAWRLLMMNRRDRSATIIQRAWRRLVDTRAEEARISVIESDERIRTALIVIGSYFVGVGGVLAASFF